MLNKMFEPTESGNVCQMKYDSILIRICANMFRMKCGVVISGVQFKNSRPKFNQNI
jgi:hypothetical protein